LKKSNNLSSLLPIGYSSIESNKNLSKNHYEVFETSKDLLNDFTPHPKETFQKINMAIFLVTCPALIDITHIEIYNIVAKVNYLSSYILNLLLK